MQRKEKNIILVLSIVFAVVVLTIGFFFLRQNKEYTNVVSELTIDRDNLASEFQDLMFEYDSLKPENDTLLLLLDQEQQKVAQLLEEIETIKATNTAKIREYRKELGTMRKVLRHYVVTIDSLNRVNQALTEENEAVKQQYRQATREVSQLAKQREELQETVELAAQLEAQNIMVETLTSKNRKTKRISKIARFKIDFNLSKNITAPTGEKPIYIRITGPNEEVYAEDDNAIFFFENKKISYTCMRIVEYEGESMPVTIFWDVNRYLFAGKYWVDIFADGNHIGKIQLDIED